MFSATREELKLLPSSSWTPLNWLTLGLGKPGMFSLCVFTQLLSKVALLANLLSDKDKKVSKVPFPTQPLHSDFLQPEAVPFFSFGCRQRKRRLPSPCSPGIKKAQILCKSVLSRCLGSCPQSPCSIPEGSQESLPDPHSFQLVSVFPT